MNKLVETMIGIFLLSLFLKMFWTDISIIGTGIANFGSMVILVLFHSVLLRVSMIVTAIFIGVLWSACEISYKLYEHKRNLLSLRAYGKNYDDINYNSQEKIEKKINSSWWVGYKT